MINKHFKKVALISLLSLAVFAVTAQFANAQAGEIIKLFGYGFSSFFNSLLANIFNSLLIVASWLLILAGSLLNFSIELTLRIKDFVATAPAIYTTWKALRDISGLFIIFFLLYESMQLILGLTKPKWGETVKNIVMAGILINFSFFFAGLGIDASNIISIQLYNAIAPANTLTLNQNILSSPNAKQAITEKFRDGGLSDIFMNSLQIPGLYKTKGSQNSSLFGGSNKNRPPEDTIVFDNVKIMLIGITGIMITLAAAISFAVAALAFIFRFVMLIFLLAFSPIWFMSFISPEIAKYTSEWKDKYKQMLIFMPVYLLLMYLAMNVLTTTPLFKNMSTSTAAVTTTTGSPTGGPTTSIIPNVYAVVPSSGAGSKWYDEFLVLAVNATLVVFLLNLPLVAAASVAGKSVPLLDGAVKNFGANTLWSKFGSQAGSRTLGRMAYRAANSDTVKGLAASSPTVGGAIAGGLSKASNIGYGQKKGGYEDRMKAKIEAQDKMHKKLGEVNRADYSSDEKYKEALKKARGYKIERLANETNKEFNKRQEVAMGFQGRYRQNVPWQTKKENLYTTGIIGFIVDNRANRRSASALGKKADDEAKKENSKSSKSAKQKNNIKIAELEGVLEEYKSSNYYTQSEKDTKIKQVTEDITKLRKANIELDAAIEEGKNVEASEKEKETNDRLGRIEAETKKE